MIRKKLKIFTGIMPMIGLFCHSCSAPADSRPNFILILFDDLGWDDLGIHGNSIIETPNMDRLANESARFSNFYVNPVSAASRASLLTGRHFLRTGVSHVHGGKDFMALDEVTLAQVLQNNGYATGMWGKWHTGDAEQYYPWQRGFDEALKLRLYKHKDAEGYINGTPVASSRWADELIVDHAVSFMERSRYQPFFAFVSLLSPHTPLAAPDSIVKKYKEKGLSRNLAALYAMVDFSDQELGRLFRSIDSMGIGENTVIMILSDNGPAVNRAELTDEDRRIRYVNNYRGHKGDIWENGVKSPLFVHWPGKITPMQVDAVTDITDIFATVLDFAGISCSSEAKPLDGKSFKGVLLENRPASDKLSFNYADRGWVPSLVPYNPDGTWNEYQPVVKDELHPEEQVISVRSGRYKLMLNPAIDGDFSTPDSIVLIDMKTDPKETTNIARHYPEITNQLKGLLVGWYREVLEEPNSYAAPVLYLNPAGETRLKATWISGLSEKLLNTVLSVKQWHGKTGRVDYQLFSETEGLYEFSLIYSKNADAEPKYAVFFEDGLRRGVLDGRKTSIIGNLHLRRGNNRVRIKIYPDRHGRNIDELLEIIIQPKQ